jgi:hypothetical protein
MQQQLDELLAEAKTKAELWAEVTQVLSRLKDLDQTPGATVIPLTPQAVPDAGLAPAPLHKPKRKPTARPVAPPLEARDHRGREGLAFVAWIRDNMPDVSICQAKPCLAIEQLLMKVVQHGKVYYYVTALGEPFFFTRPYAKAGSHPELFVTPEGMLELFRLYRAGKLSRRPGYRHLGTWMG